MDKYENREIFGVMVFFSGVVGALVGNTAVAVFCGLLLVAREIKAKGGGK